MGKRELVLIVIFAVAGGFAYRLSAPPSADNADWSVGGLTERLRQRIEGPTVRRVVERHASLDVPEDVETIVVDTRGRVALRGEDRDDLSATLRAAVFGFDAEDAEDRARELELELDHRGARVFVEAGAGDDSGTRQSRPELDIAAPAGLEVDIELGDGSLSAEGLRAVRLDVRDADVTLTDLGTVSGETENVRVSIERISSGDLRVEDGDLTIGTVEAALDLVVRDASARIADTAGPVEVEVRDARLDIAASAGPLRLNGLEARIAVRAPAGDVEIEAEDTEVTISLDRAIAVRVSTSGASLEVRLPAATAFEIDAEARNGRVIVPDELSVVSLDEDTERVAGTLVAPDGPLLHLRNTDGDIIVLR